MVTALVHYIPYSTSRGVLTIIAARLILLIKLILYYQSSPLTDGVHSELIMICSDSAWSSPWHQSVMVMTINNNIVTCCVIINDAVFHYILCEHYYQISDSY